MASQQQLLQDNGEPPFLAVGTEVSAKYKGAFCEARIQKVERLVKCRVTFKNNLGTVIVTDDNIKGTLRVGAQIEAKHPDKNCYLEATISKIIDASQYTVIFDDGDITTLRRTSLCLKSGKHFAESESLDHLPLTNPEHFGNPVSLNARGNRRRRRRSAYSTTASSVLSSNTAQFSDNDDESIDGSGTSVDDEDSSSIVTHQSNSTTTTQINYKLASNGNNGKEHESLDYGKVICVDHDEKRSTKLKDLWFPGLIVLPSAQENSKVDTKENYLVKSFVNGRFYPLPRKDCKEFTKELGSQILNDSNSSTSLKSGVEKAVNYLDKHELPASWDYEALVGSSSIAENGEEDNESSSDLESLLDDDLDLDDEKSNEEKDRFVAQLYKYMDERGTPINKTPTIWNDDLDLYNLYRLVIKMGGYNRVTNKNGWKTVYSKLLPNNENATQASANQLRLAYKKYLLNFVDFFRKLGCTMVDTCLYSSRTGTSRTARSERNWRNLSESAKPEPALSKEKTRRKKSTATNESTAEKKEEDDKKTAGEDEKNGKKPTTVVKRARKYGRKKFKLGAGEEDSSNNVNGNEPEEKYIPNDSDFESDSDNFSTPTIPKESIVAIGDRIRVKYGKGKQLKVYEAKVMNLVDTEEADDPAKLKYFVHYTGWNTRYDEWIKRNRIVEIVCDKSPKRRGGNKSKNKGVPLSEEQQAMVQVKPEPVAVKAELQAASLAILGKRGRPSATNFRNQPVEKPTVETKLVKNEPPVSSKKQPAASPTKRSRQRSECLEIDQDDNEQTLSVVESTKKADEMEVENSIDKQDTEEEESTESKEPEKRYGYKKLKRSDSFRSISLRRQEPEKPVDAVHSDDESASRKISSVAQKPEEDQLSRRKRKKKNEKTTPPIEQNTTPSSPPAPPPSAAKEKEDKQSQQPQSSVAASAKKRKAQSQQNVSSSGDEDDSNSSSNMANKLTKRKRILNSKYRQDNALVKTEATSSQPAKEIASELPRKRSKEETSVKSEKLVSQQPDENQQQEATKKSTSPKSKETTETEPATVAASSEPANNFLLCKEEIPASPSCDENSHQQLTSKNSSTLKNSSTSDNQQLLKESKLSSTNKQPLSDSPTSASAVAQKSGPSSLNTAITATVQTAKLCSIIENSKEIQKEKIKSTTSVATSKQSVSPVNSKENSTANDSSSAAKKESDETECVQFTPPTTPESLKSNSTVCSQNDKESNDEKTVHDKADCETEAKEHDKIETHGLDMIATASSKLDELEKQNNESLKKKENLDAIAPNNNFSPRKKRRGRGRTSSQSEQTCGGSLASNLFNTSYSREKDALSASIKELSSSIQKVKGCKTRGSLGRKVKQNQNIDCTSESTSHSDNLEPTSPSILNCISLDFYNPTSKYNFCMPLDESLETDKRIQILQERLTELRKTYLNIKSELATIERRRKKCKRKERNSMPSSPGSQTENQKTNSPQSASSIGSSNKDSNGHHSGLQRSNSFSTDSTNHLEASEPVC